MLKDNYAAFFCLTQARVILFSSQKARAHLSSTLSTRPLARPPPNIRHTVPYKKLVISGSQKAPSQEQAEPSGGQRRLPSPHLPDSAFDHAGLQCPRTMPVWGSLTPWFPTAPAQGGRGGPSQPQEGSKSVSPPQACVAGKSGSRLSKLSSICPRLLLGQMANATAFHLVALESVSVGQVYPCRCIIPLV